MQKIRNETVVLYFPRICQERLGKITRNFRIFGFSVENRTSDKDGALDIQYDVQSQNLTWTHLPLHWQLHEVHDSCYAVRLHFHVSHRKSWLVVLTRLLHIREVPGSNLGRERVLWLWIFVFSSVPPGKWRDRFLPHPFQLIVHLQSFISTLYSYYIINKASLNI
jgi:hypothetical protein